MFASHDMVCPACPPNYACQPAWVTDERLRMQEAVVKHCCKHDAPMPTELPGLLSAGMTGTAIQEAPTVM